jgi:hypothetical protein
MKNPLQILGGVAGAIAGYLATLLLPERDRADCLRASYSDTH